MSSVFRDGRLPMTGSARLSETGVRHGTQGEDQESGGARMCTDRQAVRERPVS